jgi:hypothetical protein
MFFSPNNVPKLVECFLHLKLVWYHRSDERPVQLLTVLVQLVTVAAKANQDQGDQIRRVFAL